MTQAEFNEMFLAAMEEYGYDESNVTDLIGLIDENVLITGVSGEWNSDHTAFAPTHYVRATMEAFKGDPGTTDYEELINKPDIEGITNRIETLEAECLVSVTQEQFNAIFA